MDRKACDSQTKTFKEQVCYLKKFILNSGVGWVGKIGKDYIERREVGSIRIHHDLYIPRSK